VSIRTNAYYRELAANWLTEAGVLEPPVDIDCLAAYLGVPIRALPMPKFFTAALVSDDGMPSILMNSVAGEGVRRHALGHVIGHMLMVMDEGATGAYPRTTTEHREADLLATAIIMPDPMVADQAGKWFNDYRYLARLFGVHENEMLDRMTEMGILRERTIRWDY
jgi:Zn-dependent peptidase ImmA (M78 family)